jgi:phosphoenolpyruvate carboxykinase (ATP)
MNYLLPLKGVMTMHCSANTRAMRTILRCSLGCPAPARPRCRLIRTRGLIGDDEHGWSDKGVFNFEGGCYAKVIQLSATAEPEIYQTTRTLRHRPGKRRLSTQLPVRSIWTMKRSPKTPARPTR